MASRIERYLRSLETFCERRGLERTYDIVKKVREGVYPIEPNIADFGIGSTILVPPTGKFKEKEEV